MAELAALGGIEPQYYDIAGNLHQASPETQEHLLLAMGYRCRSPEDLQEEVRRCRGLPWTEVVEPVLALWRSQLPAAWHLYLPLVGGELPADLTILWELTDEAGCCWHREEGHGAGAVQEQREIDGQRYGRLALPLPDRLQWGYYTLRVWVESSAYQHQAQQLLIVAPDQVHVPAILSRQRLWGVHLPLYALASSRNWGLGDCGDLRSLVSGARRLGADLLGLNPLHHLGPWLEDSISPYYPTSRCFPDPLYLALDQVPEAAASPEAREYLQRSELQQAVATLRRRPQVDYVAVARLKRQALAVLYAAFLRLHGSPEAPRTARGQAFSDFVARQGALLEDFALFLALAHTWREQGYAWVQWQDWPAAYHDPTGPAVQDFRRRHQQQVMTEAYGQWLLAEQLAGVQAQAHQEGLALGLYLDLAVGVNPGGFDTWRHRQLFAQEVDIGAPPDDFSPLGQNWHLMPLSPRALRRQQYRYFIDVLRHNCLPGGALRIDHVMGFFRLYWIPRGASAAQGAYVRYPAAEMLKILALESVRQQTLIIGEDLGTVAPSVREELATRGVFSTRLFYFERQEDGSCLPAEHYPTQALVAVTTHDLPTLAGFWEERDIQVRQDRHLLPDEQTRDRLLAERRRFKEAIVALLHRQGALTPEAASRLAASRDLPEEVKWGILAHLATTPCRLLLLNLEDIFGWPEQQNLPGTKDEYPNWRLKLPLRLEDILPAPELVAAARLMQRCGRGRGGSTALPQEES